MPKSKLTRMVLRWLKILSLLYFTLFLAVFLLQRRLLYHPDKISAESMMKEAGERGFTPWQNAAGEFIGWKQAGGAGGERNRILIVHGNAGCAINRLDYASALQVLEPFDVYILEYPGFGGRPGSPSQQSLLQAADEAAGLLEKQGAFYVLGESLGTGVAAYLAGAHPQAVRGMVLLAPYHDLTEVAQSHVVIFPVKWMLRDKFPSAEWLAKYHGPVAFVLAGRDVVVPNRFGRELYESYQGPKMTWEVPQAGHESLPVQTKERWKNLITFWHLNAKQEESPTAHAGLDSK